VTGRRAAPAPVRLADCLDAAITRLSDLAIVAGNERRTHRQTEQLLDDVEAVARTLRTAARG
jgi:hypothetical protein